MELWIRSQNKSKLAKTDIVYVTGDFINGIKIMGCSLHYTNENLGTYATKERALEVLNEIQKILQTFNPENMAKAIVYEMPEK